MKLSQLLRQREALLWQSRLANLAFAYGQLAGLAARIAAARLRGPVRLQSADPAAERYCPELTALAGSQAVIEEHFTDENVLDLADLLGFLTGRDDVNTTFRLEDLTAEFLTPLRRKLERAGVDFDAGSPGLAEPRRREPEPS